MFADDRLGPVRQWGFLVRDLDEAMTCWVEQLGIGPWWGYRNVTARSIIDGVETQIEMNVGLAYSHGVQIELIHQTNEANSPYRYFYERGSDAQALQQIAYMVPDVELAAEQCIARGMRETGRIVPLVGGPYIYLDSPEMRGLVTELMPFDQDFMDEYERCAREAETWDGREPFRLITF